MDVIWLIFLFVLAACVGSFLNVVIYRLPRGQSIVFPSSHCPACGHGIRWHDNIPLLSWLLLGGRCRFCRKPISPRYLVIEAVTAVLIAGLYVWYFMARQREGAGSFQWSWPMFAAHGALLCGLLVCSAVDIESWIVPLGVCWFVSLAGAAAATASPPAASFLPRVSPTTGAMGIGAGVGLLVAIALLRRWLIQPSFLDADEKGSPADPEPPKARRTPQRAASDRKDRKARKARKAWKSRKKHSGKQRPASEKAPARPEGPKIRAVAMTKAHGVNPRKEILREVLFLAPAFVLAIAAALLVTRVPWAASSWGRLNDVAAVGRFAAHFRAFQAALWGYLIGGLWIWGARILGTLGFGKEAMGMGDVHIMAAVGAVTGWIVPSVAFFAAPFLGLVWAIGLWTRRRRRELPYGPWLALATLAVLLFYDRIVLLLRPYAETMQFLCERWSRP